MNLNKCAINYLYFGTIFAFLLIIHIFHIWFIDIGAFDVKMNFTINAVLQCVIEISLLLMFDCWMRRHFHKSLMALFIAVTFFLFLAHLADFFLLRMIGIDLWNTLDLVFNESLENLIEMLKASNISFFAWIFFSGATAFIFLCGIFFYQITDHLLKRFPIRFSYRYFVPFFACSLIALVCVDKFGIKKTSSFTYERYRKALPWKTTFGSPEINEVAFSLGKPKSEEEMKILINQISGSLEKKPPIFIFVIESLRADFITNENSPFLSQFKESNLRFETSISSANATHLSWFSIFHSKVPLYWTKQLYQQYDMGSPPLNVLKNLGYKIHVYTSAELSYYHMGELIFGSKHHLADSFSYFPYGDDKKSCESDASTIQALCSDLTRHEGGEGRVYIVFLDSTHFDYSWPRGSFDRFMPVKTDRYKPIKDDIDYLNTCYSKRQLDAIKNRYRNAVFYTDSLIGQFLAEQKRDDAIVVITGDHGEEFYEHGHMFHTSSLSLEQTEVPIYYKLGSNEVSKPLPKVSSHLDIFPTIFEYLCGNSDSLGFMEGESLFKKERLNSALIAKYNMGRNPCEFCIHNGSNKYYFQFSNSRNIFDSKSIQLLGIRDRLDNEVISHEKGLDEALLAKLRQIGQLIVN